MENVKTYSGIVLIAAVLLMTAGCNESAAQKKQAMHDKWRADSAQSKVPLITGMIERGEITQARNMLTQCLKDDADNPHYLLLMGQVEFAEEDYPAARQHFQAAIEGDDQLGPAWHCLGVMETLDRSWDRAIEDYRKACQLEPENTRYVISLSDVLVKTGQGDLAAEMIDNSLRRHAQDMELILALAQIKQQGGRTDQAVGLYEQALLLFGDQPEILSPCAYSYMSQGKWAKATDMFERLLSHYKDHPELYNSTLRSLAACSFNCGNYGRAMSCYDELSVTYRDDADIWLSMAQCALGADDTEKAVYYAKKALKQKAYLPGAHAVLGSCYYLKQDYSQSLDSFHRITDDQELGGFAWFMAGRCYQQLGQTEQASVAYQRAEKLDPDGELITVFLKKTVQSL